MNCILDVIELFHEVKAKATYLEITGYECLLWAVIVYDCLVWVVIIKSMDICVRVSGVDSNPKVYGPTKAYKLCK